MHEKFSKIGFVLAMAGSAVGLGNAWKFPTMVGNHGGSAFILLYLFFTIFVAAVAFLAESAVGKLGESDTVTSLERIAPSHKKAWSLGGFFMIGAVLIASFYLVVIGWIAYYVVLSFTTLPTQASQAGEIFNNLISNNAAIEILCFSAVFGVVFYTVSKGIKNGIERLNMIMMPMLLVLLILMLLYACFKADGFTSALAFIFIPDFNKIFDAEIILQALGLALFSLSIGVCTISTYSASLNEDTNVFKSVLSIIAINIAVGVMMGLIVFSFIPINASQPAASGPGLIFVSLLSLFGNLGVVGNVLGVMFFISLLFAGITSAVSMIEPFVLYLINHFHFTRVNAILSIGAFVFILGVLCALSYYEPSANALSFSFGANKTKPFFDVLDFLTSNILMPLGALFFSVFVGWVLKKEGLVILFSNYVSVRIFEIWYFLLRFILPLGIIAVAIYSLAKA